MIYTRYVNFIYMYNLHQGVFFFLHVNTISYIMLKLICTCVNIQCTSRVNIRLLRPDVNFLLHICIFGHVNPYGTEA